MKWLRWRWRHGSQRRPTPADEALEKSRRQLAEVRRQAAAGDTWLEDLADRFRRMREENHLAEKFRDALEGR